MVRDKALLSDKDLFRNTADIIESAKECKINLSNTTKRCAYVDSDTHTDDDTGKETLTHSITIGAIKGVEKFTLLNHELGHVMFDSPISAAREMIKSWAMDFPKKYEEAVYKTYWGALNIIEDQRIESLMAKIWLNNNIRFNKARENLGKNMAETMAGIDATLNGKGYNPNQQINPIQCLLATRFLRDDIAKKSPAYEKAKIVLDKVEGTGQTGALIGVRMIKNEIDRYIKDMIEMCTKRDEMLEKLKTNINTYKDNCRSQDKEPDEDRLESMWDKLNDKQGERKPLSDWNNQLNNLPDTSEMLINQKPVNLNSLPEPCKPESASAWTSPKEEEINQEDLMKALIESKEEGSREVTVIKESLSEDQSRVSWADNVEEDGDRNVVRCGLPVEQLAKGMNKLFKRIQGQPKSVVGHEGDEVDIESYVLNKTRGYDIGECMIDTKYVNGASVLVSVDGSSSMDNYSDSMRKARDLVATLYKSIEGIPNIHLEAIVWSGSGYDASMEVTHVKSLKDTEKMGIHSGYPLTPTHLAIQYSANMVRAMPGRKKLLIIITDGHPQFCKNGTELPTPVLCQMANKEMQKGLRKCANIVGMLITPHETSREACKTIFGKRFLEVPDMNDGAKVIVKQFQKLVAGVLGR